MKEGTYGQLEEVLLALGFTPGAEVDKNKVFLHEPTGALIVYPAFPRDDAILPRHRLMVRSILEAYGIADPTDFEGQVQKAS
jgi:hypothetical protein